MARLCLPAWRTKFAHLSTGSKRPKIHSGCYVSGGNVQCAPEVMRAATEDKMRKLGYWGRRKLPLTVYTAARYVASEVGCGTPEEKVAVIEAAIHRTKLWRLHDVNDLLLHRQRFGHPNDGWYGPIHLTVGGVRTSPYGRWAATSADPGIDDILIADFVLAGKTKNFSRGAAGQYGMEHINDPVGLVKKKAADRNYWVGPLPNVDHWHTFLFVPRPDIALNSMMGQMLQQRGLAAVTDRRRPDWGGLPICSRKMPVSVFVGLALAAGLGLAYATAVYVEPTWRGHWLTGRQSRVLEQNYERHRQYRRGRLLLRRRR